MIKENTLAALGWDTKNMAKQGSGKKRGKGTGGTYPIDLTLNHPGAAVKRRKRRLRKATH